MKKNNNADSKQSEPEVDAIVRQQFFDKNGKEIKAGNVVYNAFNQPPYLPILQDSYGNLFLEDYETPLSDNFRFDTFWEIVA